MIPFNCREGGPIARIYLTVVGLLYIVLAIWCSVAPATVASKVGFSLRPGSGQSEFLTVYGGLEFGLALIFLLPLVRPEAASYALLSCLLIHASLVAFRSTGFVLYTDFSSTTYNLAIGEWLLFLSSAVVYFISNRNVSA